MSGQDDCYREEQVLAMAESLQSRVSELEMVLTERDRTIRTLRDQTRELTDRMISQQKTIEEIKGSELLLRAEALGQKRRCRCWIVATCVAVMALAVSIAITVFI